MSMTEETIREKFLQGYDCSQVVMEYFAGEADLTAEQAQKVSACFGGGMLMGDTCGAFVGGLMAVGMKYGHHDPEHLLEQKEIMMAKSAEFREKFFAVYPSCKCKDMLGYDVSTPEGLNEALESGRMLSFCPQVVKTVIGILEGM